MLPIHFLKRYFPHAPDWFLRGLSLVLLLWLIVLPIEIFQVLTKQDFLHSWGWLVRPFYIYGLQISMFLVSSSIKPSYVRELTYVLLGLIISSPAYFVTGILLESKNRGAKILGVLLFALMIFFGCYMSIAILVSFG